VVAPTHPFAGATALEPEDLAGADWVLREAGSGTRSAFEAALTEAGLAVARFRVTLELPSNEAVRAAVEAGGGAAVLSETVVAAALRAGTLVRAAFDLPSRPFRVLRHKERYCSRAADALLDLIATANIK
ncbi:LysR substrate-binding domain-containing protein, partial [Methylobacterium sp. Leaf469]|uniref:LysR substrate-binding domain-containing protein n=1 Tax=Methylobacterium sp. Leaf469 TaxID=1736387 RepID=UPI001FCDAB6E